MTNVVMPRRGQFKPAREITVLEDDKVRALEKTAKRKTEQGGPKLMHADLIVFMVHIGLRCGEVLALQWSDIDFERKTMTVNRNLTKIKERDRGNGSHKRNLCNMSLDNIRLYHLLARM